MVRYLILRRPDGSSHRIPMAGESMSVGRAKSNQLSYPDDHGLSRHHLVFERQGDEWTVRDLASKNGTLVNGIPLRETRSLRPGDRVTAGRLVLEYCKPEELPAETVIFVSTEESVAPTTATVMTTLEGALTGRMMATTGGVQVPAAAPALVADRQIKALIRAGRELAGHLALSELFDVILGLSIDAVSASRGVLMTLEGGGLVIRAARGEGFRISGAVRNRVLNEKTSLLVRDVHLDEAFRDRLSIVEQKVRSIMAVPLQTSEKVIGLIYVDTADIIGEFIAQDLNLLTVMANVAAIRIEHARLAEVEAAERAMARDLQQAAEIQRQFLPSSAPEMPGLDLAGYNAACRTVGGDYYCLHPCPDGRAALVVADVAGKGMPAALLMSNLQAKVQVLLEQLESVEAMISRLNRLLASSCPGNRFITFFLGVISADRQEIVYCNAGHNPPLLVHSDGHVETLRGGGMILGVLARATYEQRRCRLEAGDVVVLYSDGVTEASRPGTMDEFGDQRLGQLLTEYRHESAAQLVERVKSAVEEWTAGAPPADDITLVVAKRTE